MGIIKHRRRQKRARVSFEEAHHDFGNNEPVEIFRFKAPHVGVGQPKLESITLAINCRSLCRDFGQAEWGNMFATPTML